MCNEIFCNNTKNNNSSNNKSVTNVVFMSNFGELSFI